MTELITTPISSSGIKMKWNESYVSDAINAQAGINTPGIYRGGIVSAEGTPNRRFVISNGTDTDTFVLCRDPSTMMATTIKINGAVTIDMTDRFAPGSTMPSDETWYVGIIANYSNGVDTTANIVVSDVEMPGMSKFATIKMHLGDTVINQTDIDISGDCRTRPITKKGIIIPIIETKASEYTTMYRADSNVYAGYLSDERRRQLVRFYDADTGGIMGAKRSIMGGLWAKDESFTQFVTDEDLDENGCYYRPYIGFVYGDGGGAVTSTDNITCRYHTFIELDNIPDGTLGNVDIYEGEICDSSVRCDPLKTSIVGTSSVNIAGGKLRNTLISLYAQIKGKVEAYRTTSSSWVQEKILSPSGANAVDTVKMYCKDGNTATAYNCSISSAGAVTALDPANKVRIVLSNRSYTVDMESAVGLTGMIVGTSSTWTNYTYVSSDGMQATSNYNITITGTDTEGGIVFEKHSSISESIFRTYYDYDGFQLSSSMTPGGISSSSDITVGGVEDAGLDKARPIVIDITAVTGWMVGLANVYEYANDLDLEMDGFEWDNDYCPTFGATVRQWSTSANFAVTYPASVKMGANGNDNYTIISIRIFGDTTTMGNYTTRQLILDLEAGYHEHGSY